LNHDNYQIFDYEGIDKNQYNQGDINNQISKDLNVIDGNNAIDNNSVLADDGLEEPEDTENLNEKREEPDCYGLPKSFRKENGEFDRLLDFGVHDTGEEFGVYNETENFDFDDPDFIRK
jgi:hypothetical protein